MDTRLSAGDWTLVRITLYEGRPMNNGLQSVLKRQESPHISSTTREYRSYIMYIRHIAYFFYEEANNGY